MNYIIKPALTMFITAAVAVAALSYVHAITYEPIRQQALALQNAALFEVLPQAETFYELEVDLPDNINTVFEAIIGGEVIGYAIETSRMGFGGPITIMVGVSSGDEMISGLRVLGHTESPGFGDPLNTEAFGALFEGMPLTPVTEIDTLTGATATRDAVIDAVNFALDWYNGGSGR